jgi:hypothetical protein
LVNISGYTARVSELLEMVTRLDKVGVSPFVVREDASSEHAPAAAAGVDKTDLAAIAADATAAAAERRDALRHTVSEWRVRCDARDAKRAATASAGAVAEKRVLGGGVIRRADNISFENVDLVSPDGKLLVKSLTCQIERGVNVMVTGCEHVAAVCAVVLTHHAQAQRQRQIVVVSRHRRVGTACCVARAVCALTWRVCAVAAAQRCAVQTGHVGDSLRSAEAVSREFHA